MTAIFYIGKGDGRVSVFNGNTSAWTQLPDHDTGSQGIHSILTLDDDDLWISVPKGAAAQTTFWHWDGNNWSEEHTVWVVFLIVPAIFVS